MLYRYNFTEKALLSLSMDYSDTFIFSYDGRCAKPDF